MTPEQYRFAFDHPGWPTFLDEHGFVVIRAVVGDAANYVAGLWDVVEALAGRGLDRRVAATQRIGRNWPAMIHGGMIQYVGHSAAQWQLRERVAPAFARLYGCAADQLASSFDGFCLMSGQRRYRPRSELAFVHTDQSPRRTTRWSIQGLVNLVDNDAQSGGLVVVPGSHRLHQQFFRSRGLDHRGDWYVFSDADKRDPIFNHHLKVCGEAGDLMLWDSRTFHCNTIPRRPVERVCAYICMLPKQQVPAAVLARRAEALATRRTTSHHPGDGFRMFPRLPRHITREQEQAYRERLPGLQPGPVGPLQWSLAHTGVAA